MQISETTKRTRTAISVKLKKEICEYMTANRNVKHADVASFFCNKYKELNVHIDRTSISKIFKDKDKWMNIVSDAIESDKYRQRSVKFPEFDKAMQIWTAQAVFAGMPLSDLILQKKGEEFARSLNIEDQIKCANGWIFKFKKRNGLRRIKYSGEANSAPLQTLPEERSKLQLILSQYNEEDIYNADETGLFFRMEPNQTLSTGPISGYKKVNLLIYYFSI
jgi:hypothetical protein